MNFILFILAFANFAEVKIMKQKTKAGTYFLCVFENEEDMSTIRELCKEYLTWISLRTENKAIANIHKTWLNFSKSDELCTFTTVELKAEEIYFVEEL